MLLPLNLRNSRHGAHPVSVLRPKLLESRAFLFQHAGHEVVSSFGLTESLQRCETRDDYQLLD